MRLVHGRGTTVVSTANWFAVKSSLMRFTNLSAIHGSPADDMNELIKLQLKFLVTCFTIAMMNDEFHFYKDLLCASRFSWRVPIKTSLLCQRAVPLLFPPLSRFQYL